MATDPTTPAAWLEKSDGTRVRVGGVCSVGRSSTNQVVLDDDRASRRHAMINAQGLGEFWLVDLGSINGSYVNGRRVIQPCRLNDGDQIEMGGAAFVFRRQAPKPESSAGTAEMTRQDIRSENCWLLVADIENSTHLLQSLPPDQAARYTGRWLNDCRQIVEQHSGAINKFLGDGFFAYWAAREHTAVSVAQALGALKTLQAVDTPRFRLVLHFGTVLIGGEATMGEDCLIGGEVNFVFRMEKLAGSLGVRCLVSDAANNEIKSLIPTTRHGTHPVQSFDGQFVFFTA